MKEEKTVLGCLGGCAVMVLVALGIDALVALALLFLWNWLIPLIFHGPQLSYLEAFGGVVFLNLIGGFFKVTSSTRTQPD